jgi:hypothetical protein
MGLDKWVFVIGLLLAFQKPISLKKKKKQRTREHLKFEVLPSKRRQAEIWRKSFLAYKVHQSTQLTKPVNFAYEHVL